MTGPDDGAEALREALQRAMSGKARLLDPLPRKVRLRLWWEHQVDGAGIWLVEHNRLRAAEMLWRTFGKW